MIDDHDDDDCGLTNKICLSQQHFLKLCLMNRKQTNKFEQNIFKELVLDVGWHVWIQKWNHNNFKSNANNCLFC